MKIQINEQNLMRNLSAVFSDNTRFVAELLQNARRAGASRVIIANHPKGSEYKGKPLPHQMIEFVDDGVGIQDFNKLLTVADSGWEESINNAEHPYGMGFLSTIFACEKMEVESKGTIMKFDCADLINGGEAKLEDYPMNNGARFVLINPKIDMKAFNTAVKLFSKAIEIEVYLDGDKLDNPARQSLCNINVDGFGVAYVGTPTNIDRYCVYLQGIPVAGDTWAKNFIHITNPSIKARMPDRESLIDPINTMDMIKSAWKNSVVKHLLTEAIKVRNTPLIEALLGSCSDHALIEHAVSLGCIPKSITRSSELDEHEYVDHDKTYYATDKPYIFVSTSWFTKDSEGFETDFNLEDNQIRVSYCNELVGRGVPIVIIDANFEHLFCVSSPELVIKVEDEQSSIDVDSNFMRWYFEQSGVSVARAKAVLVESELGIVLFDLASGYSSLMILPMDRTGENLDSTRVLLLDAVPDLGYWYQRAYDFKDEYEVYYEDHDEEQSRAVMSELLTLFSTTSEERILQVYANELRWILINAGVAVNEQFTVGLDENKDLVLKVA